MGGGGQTSLGRLGALRKNLAYTRFSHKENNIGLAHEALQDLLAFQNRQVGVENVCLIRGVVAGGVCIEGTAPRLERESNLARAAPFGSLEDHVFQQVSHTGFAIAFMT